MRGIVKEWLSIKVMSVNFLKNFSLYSKLTFLYDLCLLELNMNHFPMYKLIFRKQTSHIDDLYGVYI